MGSFGIEIARQAGLPSAVINSARIFLEAKKQASPVIVQVVGAAQPEVSSVVGATSLNSKETRFVDALKGLDVDDLTPRQALDVLCKLKSDFVH